MLDKARVEGAMRLRRLLTFGLVALILLWLLVPVARAGMLMFTAPWRGGPGAASAELAAQTVRFSASDGVTLQGWFLKKSAAAPTIILVAGFKEDRLSMVPYARFLRRAGYNVLLYDSRGTGSSGGRFSLGMNEVDDVAGAITYLHHRTDLHAHHLGLLGVSLGAGVVIVAAARVPAVAATVADSAYVDQRATVDRLDTFHLSRFTIPFAPLAPWAVDRLLGASLSSFSPLAAVHRIRPRGLLLIHSRHDLNPTTPPSGARRLLHAAASPTASLWLAPYGGHAGALAAQPSVYQRHVIAFFRRFLPVKG